MPSAPTSKVQELQALLAEVTNGLAQRSVDIWRPAYGSSPARNEADKVASYHRADGVTLWGSEPLEVVWKASELMYSAVLEHARAVSTLMVPPFRTWAPSVEVRAAVEAAAQVSSLLDPSVPDGRARVGRYYTLRLYAARQLEYTYNKVNPCDPLSNYGKPLAEVEAEAASLALAPVLDKNQDTIGYEGQKVQKIDDLVKAIVGDNGEYSVLSGASHSAFWLLLGGYQWQTLSPLGLSAEAHAAESESFAPIVRACLQALFKPLDHVAELFDRKVLANDLERLHKKATGLIGR